MGKEAVFTDRFQQSYRDYEVWIADLCASLHYREVEKAGEVLRAVLHALRNHLKPEQAVKVGDMLPALFRGLYYESWRPAWEPGVVGKGNFREKVQWLMSKVPDKTPEEAIFAVFGLLANRLPDDDIEELSFLLPEDIAGYWKKAVAHYWT